jgi:hypothetical protein
VNRRKERAKPVQYSQELAGRICDRLAAGETLRAICRDDGMPHESSVREWAQHPEHPFSPQYARARETGYHAMADELLEIADEGSGDAQRDRLSVETRKWLLSKALPKVYGDRLDLNATVTKSHEQELEELDVLERVATEQSRLTNGQAINGSNASVALREQLGSTTEMNGRGPRG